MSDSARGDTNQHDQDEQMRELFRLAAEAIPVPESPTGAAVLARYARRRLQDQWTFTKGALASSVALMTLGIVAWLLWPRVPVSGGTGTQVAKVEKSKEPRVVYCERIAGGEVDQSTTRSTLSIDDAGGVIPIVVSTQASQGWAYHLTPSRANKVGSLTFEQPDLLRGSVRTTWAESGRHRVVVILGGTDDTASQVAQSLDAWLTPEDLEHLADLPTGPEADATIRDHIAKVLRDNGWTGSASEIVVALSFQVVTTE